DARPMSMGRTPANCKAVGRLMGSGLSLGVGAGEVMGTGGGYSGACTGRGTGACSWPKTRCCPVPQPTMPRALRNPRVANLCPPARNIVRSPKPPPGVRSTDPLQIAALHRGDDSTARGIYMDLASFIGWSLAMRVRVLD